MNQNKNFVLWLTGYSASGKTTIAKALLANLKQRQIKIYHLDGDEVRDAQKEKLGFHPEDRNKNIKLAIDLTLNYLKDDHNVIASFISPYKIHRQWGREKIDNFIEVFVDTPLHICEQRDPKGMYKKARLGQIDYFTGVSDIYERPDDPHIHIQTAKLSVQDSVGLILSYLEENNFLK